MDYSALRDFDYLLKYTIIGDPSVGKTAMLLRYIDNIFEESYVCTIGVDFKIKTLNVDGRRIKLQLWDTAGQERFKPITNCYFRGSHGCVVVFDVCSRDTFDNVPAWVASYQEQITVHTNNNIIIIGNKVDKEAERTVHSEEARVLTEALHCEYFETSAKTGENLARLFEMLTGNVVGNIQRGVQCAKLLSPAFQVKALAPPHKGRCCTH